MTVGPDVTAVTVTRLSPNTSYTINARAANAIGEGEWSEQVMVNTISQGWCNIKNYTELTESYCDLRGRIKGFLIP